MKFSVKDFSSKCDQFCSFLQICSHLLEKSLMENFSFWAVYGLKKSISQLRRKGTYPIYNTIDLYNGRTFQRANNKI